MSPQPLAELQLCCGTCPQAPSTQEADGLWELLGFAQL